MASAVLHEVEPAIQIDLEPVDSVVVTTLMDNVTVIKAGREHRFLFDAGTSPDGVTENMRRLDIDPSSIEAIVCSHGHFDHTTGYRGAAAQLLVLPVRADHR
jgi:glyoxylase-like metal-dependent hydrolase (beta-lactamase superfamily II)